MQKRLTELLIKNGIEIFGFLPLKACKIQKPHLLERACIQNGSVAIFAIPYYTRACDAPKNISSYAIGKDYHLFFKHFSEGLLKILREEFPTHRFAAFADHSPINEREAAAMAGLGILGKHGLLITEKYSSYIFLGEIITDSVWDIHPKEAAHCDGCGACEVACPLARGEVESCLSEITQKKQPLSQQEQAMLGRYNTVWGCDLCQQACPHTRYAKEQGTIYTPLTFFEEDTLPMLSRESISKMDDEAFASRAYSWRGREILSRNLTLSENENDLTKGSEKEHISLKKDQEQ